MRVCRLALVMSVMAAVTASAGAGSIWQWRGDGTGRFPEAQPPTEWGPETNVLWKVLLPGPSNASPIIVGDKIFVCSDQPGKKGTDRVTGLVCVDKNAGGILWSKTVVLSEVYGDEQWQTVLKRRDELAALQRRRGELDKQIGELKRRYDLRTEEARKRDDEGRRKQWERQAAAAKQRGRTIPPYQPLDYGPIPTPEQVAQMTSQSADLRAQRKTVHDQTGAYVDIAPPSVDGVNGYTTPTPVTDGRCVYVLFATGVVACYDLTGERKWAVNVGPSTNGYGQAASPVLAGDRLIVPVNGLRALDKATGRQVWHAPGVRGNYGTPMPITIGGQAMVVTDHGEIVRVEDGQVVARGMGGLTYASPVVCDGVAYFIDGKATGTEVPAATAKAPLKPLWRAALTPKQSDNRYYASPVLHEGIIYGVNQFGTASAVDAATGQVLWEQKLAIDTTVYPSVAAAGEYVFFGSDTGKTAVVKAGRTFELLRINTLEQFRSSPVFEGSRMYVRGLKHLYCIGQGTAAGPAAPQSP